MLLNVNYLIGAISRISNPFKNITLRLICGPNLEEGAEGERKLYNEEVHYICSSPNRMINLG
jgi:hypothetical protein